LNSFFEETIHVVTRCDNTDERRRAHPSIITDPRPGGK
jgi:hypothetical protein